MLAMWVPELPFQLAVQRERGLEGRPLAFLNPETPRAPSLWIVNRAARQEGLVPGYPMDLALRACAGLRVLDPAPQTWWEAQGALGHFLEGWSPQGQLLKLGEALLDLRGTARLHGSPLDAAEGIRKEMARSFGWIGHGGLSESATAAQFAAREERRLLPVGDGAESTFLAPYPLTRLPGLSPQLQARLRRLGLALLGDLQPVPLPTLAQLTPEDEARSLLAKARGEDRPRLPLLGDPPAESRLGWRLEPPRLPEAIALAEWALRQFWKDPRSPRALTLRWWDVDGRAHRWKAGEDLLLWPPLRLAPAVERSFRTLAERRLLVHRLELQLAWGLGRAQALFQEPLAPKYEALEGAVAHLRKRFPGNPVLPGWMGRAPERVAGGLKAAEAVAGYRVEGGASP